MTDQRIMLRQPRMRVVLGDPEDESTWEEYEVQTIGSDQMRVEELFAQRKWGKPLEEPFRLNLSLGYFAMNRTGRFIGTLDEFIAQSIETMAIAQEEVFPTVPDPVPA